MAQKTILVVDDSEVIRKLNEVHLKRAGYDVLLAENGRVGVQMARKHSPDAIVMDVQMPEMDGYEATRLIRKVHNTMHTPIIMLTSLSTLANMQAGYDAGADDYLTKPFKPNELVLRVAGVLQRVERASNAAKGHETLIIGVFSLRGGAGCTSFATNLAVGLAQLWESPTVLADLVTPIGACDLLLNETPPNNIN
ncbi:MAG: response regulator, partial [Chloroflexota bacterium]